MPNTGPKDPIARHKKLATGAGLYQARHLFTPAELKGCISTPVEIVPQPGPGRMIVVERSELFTWPDPLGQAAAGGWVGYISGSPARYTIIRYDIDLEDAEGGWLIGVVFTGAATGLIAGDPFPQRGELLTGLFAAQVLNGAGMGGQRFDQFQNRGIVLQFSPGSPPFEGLDGMLAAVPMLAADIADGGTGYTPGDTVTFNLGPFGFEAPILRVTATNGETGAVTAFSIENPDAGRMLELILLELAEDAPLASTPVDATGEDFAISNVVLGPARSRLEVVTTYRIVQVGDTALDVA